MLEIVNYESRMDETHIIVTNMKVLNRKSQEKFVGFTHEIRIQIRRWKLTLVVVGI